MSSPPIVVNKSHPTLWLGCSHFHAPEGDGGYNITHSSRNLANIVSTPYPIDKPPPKFTNLEFISNLEHFLLHNGSRNIVVIGHVNCYGIQRARLLTPINPHDSGGGQICFIDDWLAPVVKLFLQEGDPEVSNKEISILNIKAQVEELEKTVMKEEERWGTQGVVTIAGLLFDDTAPGMQTTQVIVREIPRREEEA